MPVPPVIRIDGVPRRYAWGSPRAIPELLGAEPDGRPVAELWFGAHQDDPSPTLHGAGLDELITRDPQGMLGPSVVDRFGPRLPFLVKLLAAETALSVQVHPTREQAQAGFDREEAAGVSREAPERNYRDRNHKPELLCALTPFDALCGFRPVDRTLRLIDRLALPELAVLRRHLVGPDGLRAAFTYLLTLADPLPVVAAVTTRAEELAGDGEWSTELAAVRTIAADFPGDVGVVVALLLNHVRLQPGEAICLAAGTVHAYLRGMGVEVMANSDNVLRAALTSKHVDVPEVLAVTDFTALDDPRCLSHDSGGGVVYGTPVDDFAVRRVVVDGTQQLAAGSPAIVVCTEGDVCVDGLADSVRLTPGAAAFVRATLQRVELGGHGTVFVAGTPG